MIRRENKACDLKLEGANFLGLNDFKSKIPLNKEMTFRLAHFTVNLTYAVQT